MCTVERALKEYMKAELDMWFDLENEPESVFGLALGKSQVKHSCS